MFDVLRCCGCGGYPVTEEEEYTSELPNEQKMQEVLDETAIATICEAIVNEKLTEVYDVIAQLKADILAIQGNTEIVTETPVELSAHQRFADVQKNFIKRKY
jgi:DNA-directed RNA polymerase subunit N (RpoN/RPB10)